MRISDWSSDVCSSDLGGEQMMTLLAGHWGAVKALTDTRMAKDEAGATKAMDDLKANAAAIARFLAGANPNLPEDTVYGLMLAHGAHHSAQIDLILSDDTAGEARSDDRRLGQACLSTFQSRMAQEHKKQNSDNYTI